MNEAFNIDCMEYMRALPDKDAGRRKGIIVRLCP